MIGATDIFVSYKAEDRSRVQPLVAALEAEGFSVWWDRHIGGGAGWREDIQQHLDAAKCVIVVWSKRSVGPEGDFVRDEATRARKRGAYLPIRLDPVDAPLGFGEVQTILLKGWHGDRSDPRFLAVAEAARRQIAGEDIAHVVVPQDRPAISRRAILAGGSLGALAIAGVGGWLIFKPAAANAKRIAVLPFANLSGDPTQAYFSDGIAEELRSSLSRVGMQVIGRTSSEAVRNMDAKAAAKKLGVANILTGSVRRSPSTIRIDAELVDGSDGVERWAQSYDRSPGDTIKIQTDIAENVADALRIALGQAGRAALTLGGTSVPAAQDLVLQLVRNTSPGELGVEERLSLLRAALALDPNYAEAQARMAFWLMAKANAYSKTIEATRGGLAEALAVANRAIAIAPEMALGYVVRSQISQSQLQIRSALADARHAKGLPGENADVLDGCAFLFLAIGQVQEALRLNGRAILLDPLSPSLHQSRAIILYFGRRYDDALLSARRSLELAPRYKSTRGIIGNILLAQGKIAEAEAEYRKQDPTDLDRVVGEALIGARSGRRAQVLDKLRSLERSFGDTAHYEYGEIYAQLGQTEDAFKELERAWDVREPGLLQLRLDPLLDPIRPDPRYAALLKKLNSS